MDADPCLAFGAGATTRKFPIICDWQRGFV
jgi:hypothetical protein